MGPIRSIRFFIFCSGLLAVAAIWLCLQRELATATPPTSAQLASNTYMGPINPVPGNPQLVRVELIVRDSPDPAGPQIVWVKFNEQSIPLKPRGVNSGRGGASFQLKPGAYTLRWKVNHQNFAWPRTVTHEEEVDISPRDLWIQITIEGDEATIS